MIGFKANDCKNNRRKVDFYNHVAATTPRRQVFTLKDLALRRSHCACAMRHFWAFFLFGRRGRGRRGLPHAQNYSSISTGKSTYPIIRRGVSLETTPLTRANNIKSVCVDSGRWHTARYNTR